jgi:hypothetical protein
MSTNAATWFSREPEHQAYLISERVNGTFWQARIVGVYWHCLRAKPPFLMQAFLGDHPVEIEWVPDKWLTLKAPGEADIASLVRAISKRVLAIPATLTYCDPQGCQIYEWHTDGGQQRWNEVQGQPRFSGPRRL